jgi:hypothetical protein
MKSIITTLGKNYLKVSMDDARLLWEIKNNIDHSLQLRKKMNKDLVAISTYELSKLDNHQKHVEMGMFLLETNTKIYIKVIDHYVGLAKKWKNEGHLQASNVALDLMKKERMKLESFCELVIHCA